ncbi:DinB family protein [Paenibacillus silviterrae]|uniref:DinB family protein n=1 Tax=Paenibacillus silviterrae TaxID=3242194 RepID=UPI002542FA95|nr:DinB family protein [Paenibacillus chinjuensis]
MKTSKILESMEQLTKHYEEELSPLSMERLTRQPSEQEWSLGQMVQHLINSALFMQLRNAERCIMADEGTVTAGEKTEPGTAIFELGGFPPARIQVAPSPQYTPGQPESKEQLIGGLNKVLTRMKELAPALDGAPEGVQAAHPRLGALNAREWFELVEMHYRHHLMQKDRLIKEL